MENIDIAALWKTQDAKIEQSLALNKQLLKEVISQKAASALQSLIRFKTRGIVAAVIYLIVLGIVLFYAIANYTSALNYFIISLAVIFLINIKALYDYIKHLVWTQNINYDGSITEIQEKLAKLQLSILQHGRVMVLQFPFWTTFYLSNNWFPSSVGWGYIIFQFSFTASFTYLSYWLYKNQTLANADKKWIKTFVAGSGGKSVMEAIKFYKEMDEFKSE
jgi:lysylphosphatidylglycerol synthetase-like protein (DUF2156 family)